MDAAVLHPSRRAAAVAFAKIGFDALSIAFHPVRAAVRTLRRPDASAPNPEDCRSPILGLGLTSAQGQWCARAALTPPYPRRSTHPVFCGARVVPTAPPRPQIAEPRGRLRCNVRRGAVRGRPRPAFPAHAARLPLFAPETHERRRNVDGDPGPSRRARIAHAHAMRRKRERGFRFAHGVCALRLPPRTHVVARVRVRRIVSSGLGARGSAPWIASSLLFAREPCSALGRARRSHSDVLDGQASCSHESARPYNLHGRTAVGRFDLVRRAVHESHPPPPPATLYAELRPQDVHAPQVLHVHTPGVVRVRLQGASATATRNSSALYVCTKI